MGKKPGIIWISHRGYSESVQENTLAAFKAAAALGYRHFETDLRISSDEHIVLLHDPALKRLANDKRKVCDLTRSQLQKIKLSDGSNLLFLDQFLEEFGNYCFTFDIKKENGDRTINVLINMAKKNGFTDLLYQQTKFLTWKKEHEMQLKGLLPGTRFYASKPECWRAGLAVVFRLPQAGAIDPEKIYAIYSGPDFFSLFKKYIVDGYHSMGAQAIAFLPETEVQTKAAIAAGFDEILSNGKIIKDN
ncbi:glycerophosphodiester phosphodiesterase [Candidatus Riflebacteria bacterium]